MPIGITDRPLSRQRRRAAGRVGGLYLENGFLSDAPAHRGLTGDGSMFSRQLEPPLPSAETTTKVGMDEPTSLDDSAGDEPPIAVAADDVRDLVRSCYEHLLDRPPLDAEIEHWVEQLRGSGTLADIVGTLAGGDEAGRSAYAPLRRHDDTDLFIRELNLLYRAILGRLASDEDSAYYLEAFCGGRTLLAIAEEIYGSAEASARRRVADVSDGQFIQLAVEIICRRGAPPAEIAAWQAALARGDLMRPELLFRLFAETARHLLSPPPAHRNDPTRVWLSGVDRHVDVAEWRQARASGRPAPDGGSDIAHFPFVRPRSARPLVSIITSMYRGGKHIDFFLRNIAAQSIFDEHCELIIVDAASDQLEQERIEAFARSRDNIVYIRHRERIGIYDAWNIAVRAARGEYCTNANLDDCRRSTSLERQAATLEALPFVDVVHQDTFYSFEASLPFQAIADVGIKAQFDTASPYSLMTGNPPHNAPMWRRTLHDDVGLFNERYESASDYEFWLRCAAVGKVFYRLADPHVAYFYNPEGISTRATSRADAEISAIRQEWFRRLVDPALVESEADFRGRMVALTGSTAAETDIDERTHATATGWRREVVHRALLGLAPIRSATVR